MSVCLCVKRTGWINSAMSNESKEKINFSENEEEKGSSDEKRGGAGGENDCREEKKSR